jgi:hypothetical protein
MTGRGGIWFGADRVGTVFVSDTQHNRHNVPVRFNVSTNRFEGTQRDDTVAPTPGEPHPTKDPVLAIVEVMFSMLVAGQ